MEALQPTHEQENDEDQENQSQPAARVISPSGAVRPGGECSDNQQEQDDQQNQSHVVLANEQVVRPILTATHAGEMLPTRTPYANSEAPVNQVCAVTNSESFRTDLAHVGVRARILRLQVIPEKLGEKAV